MNEKIDSKVTYEPLTASSFDCIMEMMSKYEPPKIKMSLIMFKSFSDEHLVPGVIQMSSIYDFVCGYQTYMEFADRWERVTGGKYPQVAEGYTHKDFNGKTITDLRNDRLKQIELDSIADSREIESKEGGKTESGPVRPDNSTIRERNAEYRNSQVARSRAINSRYKSGNNRGK